MKKIAVLLVVLGGGVLAALLLFSPERRACSKMVDLCGGKGDNTKQMDSCREMFTELKKSAPDEAPKLAACINDEKSNSCGAVAGCQAGTAFNVGAGAVKGLFEGMGRAFGGGK